MSNPSSSNSGPDVGSSRLPVPIPAQLGRSLGRPIPHSHTTESAAGTMSAGFVWRVIKKWWMWTLPLGFSLAIFAAGLVWLLHVPQYEATTMVLIESNRPYIAFEDRTAERGAADRYVETQIELMQSPAILTTLISRPEIASIKELRGEVDPIAYLRKHLNVKQVGKSELYNVTYVGPSAADAATIANTVVAQYLLAQQKEDEERAEFVIGILGAERDKRGKRISELRQKVVTLAKQVTGKDPFGLGTVTDFDRAMSPVGGIYQSMNEAEVEAEVLAAEIQALRKAPIVAEDSAVKSGLLELELSNRNEVRDLEAQIAMIDKAMVARRSQLLEVSREPPEKDLEYGRLKEQSTQAKDELAKLKNVLRGQLLEVRTAQRKVETEQLINTKTQQLAILNGKRELFSKKLDAQMKELSKGGAESVEFEFAKAELDREEKIYDLIASRTLALQTESRAPARVSRRQSASVPLRALDPVPYKLMILACLMALGFPAAVVIAGESLIPRVGSADQLAEVTTLPVLGEVSRLPVKQVRCNQGMLTARQRRETIIFTESIDSLRTNLVLAENLGSNDKRCVIAVCSAASGEGKTCVASHLAVSFAEASKRPTLLIDGDLRSPDVATFFGIRSQPGLFEVLVNKVPVTEAIQRIGESSIYVLPAGERKVNPHQVLSSEKIDELLKRLRASFPVIVLDTPPVLGASEALFYAKAADITVFCSLAELSRVSQARLGASRLRSAGARLVGAVLSGIPVGKYLYDYGSYEYSRQN